MMKPPHGLKTFCSLAILFLLSACGASPAPIPPTTSPKPLIPLSAQLSWEHTIEFSGFQAAEKEGYYTEAGLAVELRPAFNAEGVIVEAIGAVVAGEADFGVASSDSLMVARAAGQPVVAIAAIYQRSPNALLSLAGTGVTRPSDLVGKTVTVSGASNIYLRAVLKNTGVDETSVNIVDRTDFSTGELTSGAVDAIDAYITNEPSTLEREGIAYNLMVFADFGVDGYANIIFVTEDTLTNRPELVEAFLRATFKGYQIAVDDPEKAATLSVEYNPALIYDNELTNMRVSVPLLHPNGSEIGMMTPTLWELAYTILRDAEIVPADFDVTEAYTLSFLNIIYNR